MGSVGSGSDSAWAPASTAPCSAPSSAEFGAQSPSTELGPTSAVESTLSRLFAQPPTDDAELNSRVQGLHARGAQLAMLRRLDDGALTLADSALYGAILGAIGADAIWQELADAAMDSERRVEERASAAAALAASSPAPLCEYVQAQPPHRTRSLTEASLMHLLVQLDSHGDQSKLLAEFLGGADPLLTPELVEHVERARARLELPAPTIYEGVLSRDLPTHARRCILEALVEAAEPGTATILERLRDQPRCDESRRDLQSALLRLRTVAIEQRYSGTSLLDTDAPSASGPLEAALEGQAFVTACDGLGTFVLLAAFERPDGTLTLADLAIRAGGDIRDGFLVPFSDESRMYGLLQRLEYETGCSAVPTTLSEAAQIALDARARTEQGQKELTEDVTACLAWLTAAGEGRVPRRARVDAEPSVSFHHLARLLSHAPWAATWFFDAGELAAVGVVDPPVSRPGSEAWEEWQSDALRRLATPARQHRLVAMATHMARWHELTDSPVQAALLRAAAAQAERDFAHSTLAAILLRRGVERLSELPPDPLLQLGDPDLRRALRFRLFRHIGSPSGTHLAQLNHTEVAYVALSLAVRHLPVEDRPRDGACVDASFELAVLWLDHHTTPESDAPTASVAELAIPGLMRRLAVTTAAAQQLAESVVHAFERFAHSYCRSCPIRCRVNPDIDAQFAFVHSAHPSCASSSSARPDEVS